jgi:DNA-binding transcriptional ArsR family regulator
MAYLAEIRVARFNELKAAPQVTQGNLSIQLRKLEEAGYIEIDTSFLGRKPLTQPRLPAARPSPNIWTRSSSACESATIE